MTWRKYIRSQYGLTNVYYNVFGEKKIELEGWKFSWAGFNFDVNGRVKIKIESDCVDDRFGGWVGRG